MCKIVFILALMSGSFMVKAGDSIRIQYGQHGALSYNLKKGSFNVYNDDRLVFSDMTAVVRANGALLSSVDYVTRSYRTAAVEDR